MKKCRYSKSYKAKVAPRCGCDTCHKKWNAVVVHRLELLAVDLAGTSMRSAGQVLDASLVIKELTEKLNKLEHYYPWLADE